MMKKQILCGLNGLALELKLPVRWLRQEAKSGRIPCLRVGNKLRFNIDAVKQILAERAASPAQEAKR